MALGQAVGDSELPKARLHSVDHGVGIDVLAHVTTQRTHLAIDVLGDVDNCKIVRSAHRPRLDPNFLHLPIRQLSARQPVKGKRVASIGVHRTHRCLARRRVVGVRAISGGKAAHR